MRFGAVSVEHAVGSILAHTVRLEKGSMKKGRCLTREDVLALQVFGLREVVVATLEDGDVAEDVAAARLARSLCGAGVEPRAPATGRCNLYATARGLFRVTDVDRVNGVDESLTLATLPDLARVEPGVQVATVKVIPFAVADRVLGEAEGRGRLEVLPFHPRRAGLVLSRLPGTHGAQLDRAARAQQARLRRLGVTLVDELRPVHRSDAIEEACRTLRARGADLLLVLGASAIADREDVVPRALTRLGGEVVRLGMPVDPGNLLLLGRWGEVDFIGIPGCARSIKRSGFDMVLERVVAGLPVTSAEVSRMGRGGLIVGSPAEQAREGARRRVSAVLLAAGASRRMGALNKLLVEQDGVPLVARVADALLDAPVDEVVVVTGHEADRVRRALGERRVRCVHNPDHLEGLASSVRCGVAAVEGTDGALIALADMPWVRASHVERLVDAFEGPDAICVPVHDRKRGNPVLIGARYFPEVLALEGDVGARELLVRYAEVVRAVVVDDPGVHVDVDVPEDLARLEDA